MRGVHNYDVCQNAWHSAISPSAEKSARQAEHGGSYSRAAARMAPIHSSRDVRAAGWSA